MDRFKSPRIESDRYMLNAMIYIDLNQYRAGKVKHPRQNDWSSYRYYAYGRKDPLITPSPSYLALEKTDEKRQIEYRRMVEALLLDDGGRINISATYFIGDPDWVIKKYNELKQSLRSKILGSQNISPSPPG